MNQRILLPAKSFSDHTSDVFQPLTAMVQFNHSAALWLLGVMEETYKQREQNPMLSAIILHQQQGPLYTARPDLTIEAPQMYHYDPALDGVNWLSCERTNLIVGPEGIHWQSRDKEETFIIETTPLDLAMLIGLATEDDKKTLNLIAGGYRHAFVSIAPTTPQ